MSSITLHHLRDSRSHRIIWLLEELQLPYDLIIYERDPETMLAPDTLKKVHPLGKSPVITDGDLTIAESGAIIEYLIERYYDSAKQQQQAAAQDQSNPRAVTATETEAAQEPAVQADDVQLTTGGEGAPPSTTTTAAAAITAVESPLRHPSHGTPERLRFTYWLHFAEGSAMPPLLLKLVLDKLHSGKVPFLIRPVASIISHRATSLIVTPNIERNLDYMETELGKSEWFCGNEFTAADIQMSFPIEASMERTALKDGQERWPLLHEFVRKIQTRAAYQRALERAGPYRFAKQQAAAAGGHSSQL